MRRGALLVGLAYGAAAALVTYALLRGVEVAFFPEPNPALLVWAARSPFAWRLWTAVYLGGAAVIGGQALAARRPEAAARWLGRAIAVAAVAVAALAVVRP